MAAAQIYVMAIWTNYMLMLVLVIAFTAFWNESLRLEITCRTILGKYCVTTFLVSASLGV